MISLMGIEPSTSQSHGDAPPLRLLSWLRTNKTQQSAGEWGAPGTAVSSGAQCRTRSVWFVDGRNPTTNGLTVVLQPGNRGLTLRVPDRRQSSSRDILAQDSPQARRAAAMFPAASSGFKASPPHRIKTNYLVPSHAKWKPTIWNIAEETLRRQVYRAEESSSNWNDAVQPHGIYGAKETIPNCFLPLRTNMVTRRRLWLLAPPQGLRSLIASLFVSGTAAERGGSEGNTVFHTVQFRFSQSSSLDPLLGRLALRVFAAVWPFVHHRWLESLENPQSGQSKV